MKWHHDPPDPKAGCICGIDKWEEGQTSGARFAIVCPRHDGVTWSEREPDDPEPLVIRSDEEAP